MEQHTFSRRSFIAGTGATAIGVTFGSLALREAQAQAATGASPIAWVRIAPDNTATIYSPGSEMGQGTMTALPMILAEEMELDWSRVRVEQAPPDAKRFGNPAFGGGMVTGSSRTVRGYYEPLRLAGLQARLVLASAAARAWGVPESEVRAENGMLIHAASGRRISYGELAQTMQAPSALPKVDKSMLKPMSGFKIIGHDVPRVDVESKTNGTARFGIDTRLPGMAWATVLYAPVQGEKPEKIEADAARAVPGVRQVVPLPNGVAVVADSFATARKAREKLQVQWSTTAKGRSYDSQAALKEFVARAENLSDTGAVWHEHGDAAKEIAGAARTFRSTYTSDHVAQFTMEPMNCTAHVTGDTIEVWTPSQAASIVIGTVAGGAGFKPENVKVHITLLGGGYGRRVEAEYALDAALVAKAVPGVPVQVIWTREDDFQRAKPRPMTAHHLVAGVDAQGKVVGLHHRTVSEGIYARVNPAAYKQSNGKDAPVMEGADGVYEIAGHRVEHCREQRGIDCSFWRGVGAGYTKFCVESFIDEIAAGTGQDPLQLRLALTSKTPRAQAVLREAAAMAGWDRPRTDGRALGLAFSDAWYSFIAMVAEVSLQQGKPVVHRIWAAVDCGHAVSPRNVRAQIEGAAIFGLSAAFGESLTYKGGESQQRNLGAYNVLRAHLAPQVEVKVLATDNGPGGIGEVGLPPAAPAVANALFKLTGKRQRSLPFQV